MELTNRVSPSVRLGGIFNSGLTWKQLGLGLVGSIFIAAGVGAFLSSGKTHSELVREERKKRRAAMMQMQNLGMLPPGFEIPPSEDDEDDESSFVPPMPGPMGRGPPQGLPNPATERRMLDLILEQAVSLRSECKFEEAGDKFKEAILLLSYSQTGSEVSLPVIIELILTTSKAYNDAGVPEKARDLLFDSISSFPTYDAQLKLNSNLAGCLITLKDSQAEAVIRSTIKNIESTEGSDSLAVAFQHTMLARMYRSLGYYSEAEKECKIAIAIHDKNYKGEDSLSKEHLEAYFQLQKTAIMQGFVPKALEIEEELETRCQPDNITFNWHLAHLAMAFTESDYDNYAEQFWMRILDRFQNLEQHRHLPKTEYDRIVSLVANSMNELSIVYYNQGRKGRYAEYHQIIKDNRWGIVTGSKYFDSQSATILFKSHEQGASWFGIFSVSVRLKEPAKVGMFVKVIISPLEGGDETYEFDITNPYTLLIQSNPRKRFRKSIYDVTLQLYKHRDSENVLYTHVQPVPCSIDTDGIETWTQLAKAMGR